MIIKNHFHKKGFALGLVLIQRLAASRTWPIWVMLLLPAGVRDPQAISSLYLIWPSKCTTLNISEVNAN